MGGTVLAAEFQNRRQRDEKNRFQRRKGQDSTRDNLSLGQSCAKVRKPRHTQVNINQEDHTHKYSSKQIPKEREADVQMHA